ncbi:aspartyl protease family protein [Rugamonas sp.]|uniref:aspartyl protease family protein n=1 Tax=Rugamonas sp. TaxID=1926287 RepID=UPI0025D1573B|nr:aspartyl protease family protein [Rugamonas sp.]
MTTYRRKLIQQYAGALALAGAAMCVMHAARAQCRYTELAALPLEQPGNGAAPMMVGTINDKPVKMLFSTGAQLTYVVKAEADRQGLAMSPQRMRMSGMSGTANTWQAKVHEIAVGPARVDNEYVTVVDGHPNASYGAIIGADFLSQADLDLSLADKQMKFFRAEGCQDKGLAYWDDKAIDIPMHSVSLKDQRQMFEVELNGQKVRAMISSGLATSIIDLATAEGLGITPASDGVLPVGKLTGLKGDKTQIWSAPFDSFAIGGETISHPRIRFGEIHKAQWFGREGAQMLLGRDFLQTHHVLLAMSQSRLYVSYLGGQVFMTEPVHATTAPAAAHGQP